MDMEKKKDYKAHCLLFPFPAQGHINPMLQFCKRLQHKGVKSTLVTTHFISKTTFRSSSSSSYSSSSSSSSIPVETVSDGYDDVDGISVAESFSAYLARFREVGSQTLADLVRTGQFHCIIYDPHLPWVLDVAKEFGLLAVAFFTQPLAVDNVYYHVHRGLLKVPISRHGGEKILVPGLTPLEPWELPSFIYDPASFPDIFDIVVNQFSNVDKADWVLCNTFYKLEQEVADWMSKLWPLGTIGPTIPSMYLDKQIQDDNNYGLNLIKPINDVCMKWLKQRSKGSVVYVSFGSVADVGVEQMEELAWGLERSNYHFLWVVRSSESAKLPENFAKETSERGLIVSWCPQLQVLSHDAIGCFVTHCGWNSTLEALSLGVPLIAMPQWTDQTTTAKYVADVWETGLKARTDEKGVVRREEIDHCISELMVGDRGKEIKRNAEKWRELAKEAMNEGGSSDLNVDQFIEFISHKQMQQPSCNSQ